MAQPDHAAATPTARSPWDDLCEFLLGGPVEPDGREEAERHLLNVRRKLEWFFLARGFADAEDLAHVTMLRVATKCGALIRGTTTYVGDRTAYFLGFARNVAREEWKKKQTLSVDVPQAAPEPDPWQEKEALDRCLGSCLDDLGQHDVGKGHRPRARHWILDYYDGTGVARIRRRREIARELGKSVSVLRVTALRIRSWLQECVTRCVDGMSWATELRRPYGSRASGEVES